MGAPPKSVKDLYYPERHILHLASIVESSSDAIISKDLSGTILSWNRGAEQLYGYSAAEVIGQAINIIIPCELQDEAKQFLIEVAAGRTVKREDTVRRHKNGSPVYVSLIISPVRDAQGQVVAASTIAHDIAERKRSEEALRSSEERFSKAFRSSPLAMSISTELEGRYLDVNQAFLQSLKYERKDVIGKTALDLGFWAQPSEGLEVKRRLEKSGRLAEFRTRYKTSKGEIRTAEASAERIELEGQQCILMITRDITETLRLEAQFRQAQKMEAVGRLAGGIAHDFNNLLGVIIGYSEVALDLVTPQSPVTNYLEQINKASNRAVALTQQLLAFSRKQTVFPKTLNLNEVVENVIPMLQRLVGEDVAISYRQALAIGNITADPGQVEQILMNLVVNARDAMPSGGQITIETGHAELDEQYVTHHPGAHAGNFVVLSVSDTGCGMDENVKSQIFEPFFTTKGVGQGTGLGLSTVYGIVKQSGGTIFVYSEPGAGTTFKIYFPRVYAKAEHLEPTTEGAQLPGGSGTILVVEDDDSLRNLAVLILQRAGYRTISASNGQDAMKIIKSSSQAIDLLLTDVIMPGLSGADLLKEAKEENPNLRWLFMSGYTGDLVALRGGLMSEVAFLEKPFTQRSLLLKVHQALHTATTG